MPLNFEMIGQAVYQNDIGVFQVDSTMIGQLLTEADPIEIGLLFLVFQARISWQSQPLALTDRPDDFFQFSSGLPQPHTLTRVLFCLNWLANDAVSTTIKANILTSLSDTARPIARQLLEGGGLSTEAALETALLEIPWRPGLPIVPEKLVRYTSQEIDEVWLRTGQSYAHVKEDGRYCQIVKAGAHVFLYVGANLVEQTGQYPTLVAKIQQQITAGSIVLEGELVGLLLKPELVLPRVKMARAEAFQVRIFDILAWDQELLTEVPYQERREKRLQVIKSERMTEGVTGLRQAQEFRIQSQPELENCFQESLSQDWEGLVIKAQQVLYRGGLRNPDCIKLKQVEPVDVTIIGYFLDKDERVRTFMMALYNEANALFEACGVIRSGLSPKQMAQLQDVLTPFERAEQPATVSVITPPDVWVEPFFVFEIMADYRFETVEYPCATPQTGLGWALYSPVFQDPTPRIDKAAHHTTPIEQFLKLRLEPRTQQLQARDTQDSIPQQLGFDLGQL